MRKKVFIASSIFLVIVFALLFFFNQNVTYVTALKCGDDPIKAAELLMEKQLNRSLSQNIPERERLVDYEIVKIGTEDARLALTIALTWNENDNFEYFVEYNVQAAAASSDWIAGNGEYGTDNWINGKVGFISFHKVFGLYIYDGIGTSP